MFFIEKLFTLSIPTSKFVSKFLYEHKTLIQLSAWYGTGDKPKLESMMTQFTDAKMRHPHYASMGKLKKSHACGCAYPMLHVAVCVTECTSDCSRAFTLMISINIEQRGNAVWYHYNPSPSPHRPVFRDTLLLGLLGPQYVHSWWPWDVIWRHNDDLDNGVRPFPEPMLTNHQ